MKLILFVLSALLLASPVLSQHSHTHQKGPNGGPVEDVAGIHLEMATSGRTITFNVLDEANKPLSAEGFSGAALVVAGTGRETVALSVSQNALKGEAKTDIAPGASVSVTLKTASGKSGQARFRK